MVSLVTEKGITQLQHFIFVLAVMQIVYTVLTMAFGRAKMRRWKAWEKETQTTDYQVANDHSDANTNSTTIFSDDTDDKSRKSTNPDICLSIHQQDECGKLCRGLL